MQTWLIENETTIRLSFFVGILLTMAILELIIPQRKLQFSKVTRWVNNLGLVVLNSILLRFLAPIMATGAAVIATEKSIGIFNLFELPYYLEIFLMVALLDFSIYLQHALVHALPLFWRLHRMHHADLDYDVTTGSRFHPIEIFISMGYKITVVMVLGVRVEAVILFEILLNATAMFNHSNIRLPKRLDQVIRIFLVTPDMHRVHHSVIPKETNSNFGFALPWWDYLCGTYQKEPRHGQLGMTIGLEVLREEKELTLPALLVQPFKSVKDQYSLQKD
ncbi:MAG: sterol desaturase family protein [SAR324 cluster bacterium]|nr:sterol desaturase family protein [SAR324 cluster bacterium]